MSTPFLMPALSPTMEKGKLAKWLKKEGDKVRSGDVLAEIETDKATMEVEAVDEGVLARILVAEGTEDVLVNTVIAVIAAEGENVTDINFATPAAVVASAPAVKIATHVPMTQTNAHQSGSRVFASPLARRLAKQRGIDLAAVQGSGPHGRIIFKDVEHSLSSPKGEVARSVGGAALQPTNPASVDFESIPHDTMRKVIARRLTESKQHVPHFYVSVVVALENLLALRERINLQAPKDETGKPTWKISVNDFIIKAMAMALHKVPDANVTWTDEAMLKYRQADIGVAVSIPGGLITPVVRNAGNKGLVQISTEMKDFAARAKNRKLKPEEYTGGTCSISNMGMMGVKDFAAIINPPQSSILAIGAAERRAVVRGNEIVIEQQMTVTLSTDHRCVDGALAAEFIGAIKMYLEEPGLMLV